MLDRIAPQPGAPTRAPVVLAALLVQFGSAVCLVLGLAAIPMVHDLHRDPAMLAGWLATALVALFAGGLAYRARLIALFVAAIACAGLGFVLPRGDSAIGVLAQLLPKGDLPEGIVMYASIAMFAIGASCLAVLPWAVPYRAWLRGDDANAPKKTLYGMAVAVPSHAMESLRMLATKRRPWLVVAAVGVAVGIGGGFLVVHEFAGGARSAEAAPGSAHATPVEKAPVSGEPPPARGGTPTPQTLIAALDQLSDPPSLFAADAFALGSEAADVASDRAAAAALVARELAHDADHALTIRATTVATDGSLAWISQDLELAGRSLQLAAIAHEDRGHWTIAALALAQPLSADRAAHLVKTKQLASLAALPAAPPRTADLAAAARAAFADRAAYTAALSARTDLLAIGRGAHAKAPLADNAPMTAGLLGTRAGWTVTEVTVHGEPMRVLAAWVHEDAGWRIVLAQWSTGGPFH